MSLAPSSILEVEPKLASRLDDLEIDKWKDRVSLLTLWFTSSGNCGLVKVEILQKAVPSIRKVGYTHKGFVDYETLLVTGEGSKSRQRRCRTVGKSRPDEFRRQPFQA